MDEALDIEIKHKSLIGHWKHLSCMTIFSLFHC